MVIDTSALLAVLLHETDAERIAAAIEAASPRLLSAANLLEASIIIESRKGEAGGRELDLLLYRGGIEGLNYGDCSAYALAKSRRLPLLFRGNDFSQTDVDCVPVP